RHIRDQSPFDLHDRHPRIGCQEAHIGTESELKAPAKRYALDRRNHGNRKLAPAPYRLLREIGEAAGTLGQIAFFAPRYPVTAAFLHGSETAHIKAGAE